MKPSAESWIYRIKLKPHVRFVLIIFSLQLQVAYSSDSAPYLRFQSISDKGFDSAGAIRSIAQDGIGFMWFAGDAGGVVRFDGYNVKHYDIDPEISNNPQADIVFVVFVDRDKHLWLGTDMGIRRYDQSTDSFIRYEYDYSLADPKKPKEVYSIAQEKSGELLFGTSHGVLRLDRQTISKTNRLYRQDYIEELDGFRVESLIVDKRGYLWVGTLGQGLLRFDSRTRDAVHYRSDPADEASLSHDWVTHLHEDYSGNIWVGTDDGLNRISANENYDNESIFFRYRNDPKISDSLGANPILWIDEDTENNLLVATNGGGLNVLNATKNSFFRYSHDPEDQHSLLNDKVNAIFEDSSGGLWFSYFPSGLSTANRYAQTFRNFRHSESNINSLSNNSVLAIAEDASANLWVGTEKGLNYINLETGGVIRYEHDPTMTNGLPANPVLSVLIDSFGLLWLGTWRGGISRFDPQSEVFTNENSASNKGLRGDEEVWALLEDSDKQVWLAAGHSQLIRHDRNNDRFIHYEPDTSHPTRFVRTLYEDSNETFWLSTEIGLIHMNREDETFQYYGRSKSDGLNLYDIRTIDEDSDGNLWVGSVSGVSKIDQKTDSHTSYRIKDGLAHNVVNAITFDLHGKIWFSTNNGLSRFDPKTEEFRNYSEADGLAGNVYNRPASLRLSSGEIAVGSTKGLSIFDPQKIYKNTFAPPVVITDFKIFNKDVEIDGEKSPLKESIIRTKKIELAHLQSTFSFEFAALDYQQADKNEYAYKLVGFDDEWNLVGNRRRASYTNLDAGKYIFWVRGSNNEGIWNNEGAQIEITIFPPWWQTLWAYLLYALIVFSLSFLMLYTFRKRKQAEDERLLNAKLLKLDKIKDTFLANTSHELRTPLNGIIGLADSLLEGSAGDLADEVSDNLRLITLSGNRLARLIDDILDISELREHRIKLNKQTIDAYRVMNAVITMSKPTIGTKALTLKNVMQKNSPFVLADEDRLQQIMYNLIGNAIKYTAEGSITVSSTVEGKFLFIAIEDTGIGIPESSIANVFDAFVQIDSSEHRDFYGTGLGLTVTKELVELHGGTIHVSSPESTGTTVRFSIPLAAGDTQMSAVKYTTGDGTHQPADCALERPGVDIHLLQHQNVIDAPTILPKIVKNPNNERFHILIVDDEEINLKVLSNLLSTRGYGITQCHSGHHALEIMQNDNEIDLILLDLMMPKLSGHEVCTILRKTYSPEQLPIIFLTAKTLIKDLVASYDVGGSDFVRKPIVKDELLVRVERHLTLAENNRKLEGLVKQRTAAIASQHNELKAIHENLKRTQSQLVQSEKMSSLGILVAGVGHELNNPLAYTNMATEIMKRELEKLNTLLEVDADIADKLVKNPGADTQEVGTIITTLLEAIEISVDGTYRIAEIVSNLRSFSRLDAPTKQASRLQAGLESTILLAKTNYLKTVEFICNFEADPLVMCVPSEINQVFMNLIVNACQSIERKVSPESNNKETLTIEMKYKDSDLHLIFRDTGVGISEETQAKMFDPFFSMSNDGTGLGLAITYDIVKRHKGRITVNSRLGEGAEIIVCFPTLKDNDDYALE